ncbi:hypothetical protein NIES4075_18000 [Tolypothrix sp. NIES-4075]|uniref:hypothetical protein n=1 Tax=Tolypothrix sp. NIES-4075 TaxID=2005459 RepID=UPI000B5C76AF|nr:hypothetical protein [Tolypothrix sp. NIES-4075]GAX40834.1 hypothetical protein NIES4075_18000 [Tolypothrix sp. NIES-4075]
MGHGAMGMGGTRRQGDKVNNLLSPHSPPSPPLPLLHSASRAIATVAWLGFAFLAEGKMIL